MKKKILSIATAVLMLFGAAGTVAIAGGNGEVDAAGIDQMTDYVGNSNEGNETQLLDVVKVIINVIIGVVGLIAVAMIVIGGIGFATSQGDPQKTKKAKDTILYGVIGLVVALLAFAVVNFVLTEVFNKGI